MINQSALSLATLTAACLVSLMVSVAEADAGFTDAADFGFLPEASGIEHTRALRRR